MERQAAKEERSRQDGPQGQVGVIMTSVGTEIFPGGSPALGGAGKQGALWNKPILPSGSWEGCIQEGTLHAWLEKRKDTLKDTSLAVHMESCSSGTPGAATASEAESCAVQGGSASVVHCTDLLSCLSKKAPGTTGVQKFPTRQQQVLLSKQRRSTLPAEAFSGFQIVQSLQWNNCMESPSYLICNHLLLLWFN